MAGNNQSVQITLGFKADTSGARQAIQELNRQLNNIQAMNTENLSINRELAEAANAAKVLQQNLQAALNVKTGQINMTQFATNLRNAGTSVQQLGSQLMNAGSAGTAAFAQLGRSIAAMDVPLKQTNATLSNFMTTIKNTAKWEISSKLIHGIESSFSKAITYAKDLNRALTDIRVVSGASIEDMAKFAQQANAAAKTLGTTTKEYAEAAKIYYQQGDSAELAAKKAEITLKATNAAFKATASEMSEMLTSTWNGYQAGADELERYVDIVANLGANTASSMEEIMTSLQKVAATANTVGVSMEQMSAMIATVSSTTRQSAEIVGTAMNTMLSRFASLKLGETLDDGVTLTKYTNALASIGVNVLDANGELRNMGNIINDIMEKWQTLSTSQKAALAQTVGSVRQYTNIMALFNNQDAYQRNMGLAQDSAGALQKMQDIRMEGWEGASKRLKASIEGIYQSLLDDQGFIAFTNSITKVIEQVQNLIQSFGGIQGIIQQVGAIALQVFSNNIGAGIERLANKVTTFADSFKNLKALNIDKELSQFTRWERMKNFGAALGMNTDERVYRQQAQAAYNQMRDTRDVGDAGLQAQINASQTLIEKKLELQAAESTMTQAQKQNAQAALAQLTAQASEIDKCAESYKQANQQLEQQQQALTSIKNLQDAAQNATDKRIQQAAAMGDPAKLREAYNNSIVQLVSRDSFNKKLSGDGLFKEFDPKKIQQAGNGLQVLTQRMGDLNSASTVFNNSSAMIGSTLNKIASQDAKSAASSIRQLTADLEQEKAVLERTGADVTKYNTTINSLNTAAASNDTNTMTQALRDAEAEMDRMGLAATNGAGAALDALSGRLGMNRDQLIEVANSVGITTEQLIRLSIATGNFNGQADAFTVKMGNIQKAVGTMTRAIGAMGGAFTSAYNMMANWDDASVSSKVMSVTSTVTQGINSIMSGAAAGAMIGGKTGGGWGALIGGVLGLGSSVAGLVMGQNEANEKRRVQAISDTHKKNVESSEATSKEISSAESLISTYNKLYETYLKTGEGQDELLKTAIEIANVYDIQGAAVLALSGNFELFNQKIRESLNYSELLTEAQKNLSSQVTDMKTAIGENGVSGVITGNAVNREGDYKLTDMLDLAGRGDWAEVDWDSIDLGSPEAHAWLKKIAETDTKSSFWGSKADPTTLIVQAFMDGLDDYLPDSVLTSDGRWGDSGSWGTPNGGRWSKIGGKRGAGTTVDDIYEMYGGYLEGISLGTFMRNSAYLDSHNGFGLPFYDSEGKLRLENAAMPLLDLAPTSWLPSGGAERSATYETVNSWVGENGKYKHLLTNGGKGVAINTEDPILAEQYFEDMVAWSGEISTLIDTLPDSSSLKAVLKSLKSSLDEITSDSNKVGDTSLGQYIHDAADQAREVEKILRLQASVSSMFGKDEQNTTFEEYTKYVADLETMIDKNKDNMEELKDFHGKDIATMDDETRAKYEKARRQIIEGIIRDTTAFDEYLNLSTTLANTFDESTEEGKAQRAEVNKLIDKKHISSMSGKTLAALKYLLDHNIALFDEATGEVTDTVQQILDADQEFDTTLTSTKLKDAKKSLKKTMEQEDLESIHSSLFTQKKGEDGKFTAMADDGTTWAQFIKMNYSEREEWIDKMIADATTKDKERLEKMKKEQQEAADTWRKTMVDIYAQQGADGEKALAYLDENYDKLTESYNRYQYGMSQYFEASAHGFKIKIEPPEGQDFDEWFETLPDFIKGFGKDVVSGKKEITNEEYGAQFGTFLKGEVDSQGNPLYDPDMIDNLLKTEGGFQKLISAYATWLGYNADTRTTQDFIDILEGMGEAADDAATKITRLSGAMSSMPTSKDEFTKLLADINEYNATLGAGQGKGHYESVWTPENYTGADLYKLYNANDKTGWYDLLIGAAEHQLSGMDKTSDEYAMKEFEIEQMRHTRDQYVDNKELQKQTELTSKYTDQVSQLQAAYKELATDGAISGKTANLLKKLGLDPNGLHTVKDINKAMDEARKKLKQTVTDIKSQTDTSVSKFFTDKAASMTWEQFKEANKDSFAEVTNLDDYEASFNAWKEAYWAWAQSMDGWDDQLDQMAAARQSKALQQFKVKTDQMQKEADKMKEAADIFTNAIETGVLSQTDKVKISASGLSVSVKQFEEAATVQERMALAAKAYSEYTAQSYKVYERQSRLTTEISGALSSKMQNSSYMSDMSIHKYNDVDSFLKSSGLNRLSDAAQQMIRDAWSSLKLDGSSGADALDAIWKYIENLKQTNKQAYDEIQAAGIDAMTAIYKSQAEQSQAAAQAEIERWKQTFQSIANIRDAILGGKTNQLSDEDWLAGFLNSKYNSPEEYDAALRSGTADNIDQLFELPTITKEALMAQYGFNPDMIGANQGNVDVTAAGMRQRERQRLAAAGYNDTDVDSEGRTQADRQAEANVRAALTRLLQTDTRFGYVGKDADEVNKAVEEYMTTNGGKITTIKDFNGNPLDVLTELNRFIGAEEYLRNTRMPQQAKAKEENTSYTRKQNDQDALIKEKDQTIAELTEYKNAAYQLAEDMGAKTVAETMKSFKMSNDDLVAKINDTMETNYASLEEIPAEVLRDFADRMATEVEVPTQEKIDAVKTKLENAQAHLTYLQENGSADEIRAQQQAVADLTEQYDDLVDAQSKAQEESFQDYLNSLANEANMTAKELQEYTAELVKNGEISASISEKEQVKYAKGLHRQAEGLDDAKKNLKSYMKELKASIGDIDRHGKAIGKLRKMYANIFDLDSNQAKRLSQTFLESAENAELLEKALNGDQEAYNQLKAATAKDLLINVDTGMAQSELNGLIDMIANYDFGDIEVGTSLDTAPFFSALQSMQIGSQSAADAISAALSSIGVDAKIVPHTVTLGEGQAQIDASGALTIPQISPDGKNITYTTVAASGGYSLSADGGTATYWTIEGANYNGRGVTRGGGSGNSGGGGGGGKKKHQQKDKQPERYHQVTRKLSEQNHLLAMNDKLKQRKYGNDYINALTKENKLLQQQITLNKKKLSEAKKYLEKDRAELSSYGATFDANGEVNYLEYQKMWDKWLKEQGEKEMDEDEWKKVQEKYEKAMQALKNYEEAQDVVREQEEAIAEAQNKIYENNLRKITYKLEIKMELNEEDLKRLDYFIKKYANSYNSLAYATESFKKMQEQMQEHQDNLRALGDAKKELDAAYANGEIDQAKYAEGLKEVNAKILEELGSIDELDKKMREWYGDTLRQAREELNELTSVMDHESKVMSNYMEILKLTGDEQSYNKLAELYDTQATAGMAKTQMLQNHLETLDKQREELEKALELNPNDEYAKQQLEDLEEEIRQTEEDVQASAIETLTAIKNKWLATIDDITKENKKAVSTTGEDLDWIKQKWQWWNSEQEFYVDTVTELYEINKLNRKIEDQLAKTRDKNNQRQLQQLQNEINLKSKSSQLTKYDLEMMELQYELLLKKQALEDAQNAKSVVSLTRDENGNYIYQYTANQDEISKKAQEYEDVLYQINQKADEEYKRLGEQILNIEEELANALDTLMRDQNISEEERQKRYEEIMNHYTPLLQATADKMGVVQQNLLTNQAVWTQKYGLDIQKNAKTTNDQVTTIMDGLTGNVDKFIGKLETNYTDRYKPALESMQTSMAGVTKLINADWKSIKDRMSETGEQAVDTRKKAKELDDQLKDGLSGIRKATEAWKAQYTQLKLDIQAYEKLNKEIAETLKKLAQLQSSTPTSTPTTTAPSTPTGGPPTTTGGSPTTTGGSPTGGSPTGSGGTLKISYKVMCTTGPHKGKAVGGNPSGPTSLKVGESGSISHNCSTGYAKGGWSVSDSSKCSLSGGTIKALAAGSVVITMNYWDRTDQTTSSNTTTTPTVTSNTNTNNNRRSGGIAAATGGLADYTGPAWVDGTFSKPEYILNADQTQEMFKILNDKTVSRMVVTLRDATTAMLAGLRGNLTTYGGSTTYGSHVAQEVNIYAEFPAATDRNEIREALNGLVARASQNAITFIK